MIHKRLTVLMLAVGVAAAQNRPTVVLRGGVQQNVEIPRGSNNAPPANTNQGNNNQQQNGQGKCPPGWVYAGRHQGYDHCNYAGKAPQLPGVGPAVNAPNLPLSPGGFPNYPAPYNPGPQFPQQLPSNPNYGGGYPGEGGNNGGGLPYGGNGGGSTGTGGSGSGANQQTLAGGLQDGFRDCLQALQAMPEMLLTFTYDLRTASQYLAAGQNRQALAMLGLHRIPDAIRAELTRPALGVSDYEGARRAAQRLCMYGMVPGLGRAAGTIARIPIAGATPFNALKGSAVGEAIVGAPNALKGKWIQLPDGPVQLGKFRGAGSYGALYEVPVRPKQLIKLAFPKLPLDDPAAALVDQKIGSQILGYGPKVETPWTGAPNTGTATIPAHMFVEDIFGGRLKGVQLAESVKQWTAQHTTALREMYDNIAEGGRIWADGHAGNVFFYQDAAGALKAGVLDSDMLFPAQRLARQRPFVLQKLNTTQGEANRMNINVQNEDWIARSYMSAMFRWYWPGL